MSSHRQGIQGLLGLVLILVAIGASASAAAEPRIAVHGSGGLAISSLPSLFEDDDVKRHLDSGLTTSFVFQLRSAGPIKTGAARVDIRLELWDEVYLVTVIDGQGRFEESEHDSAEALEEWWSKAEFVLSATPADTVRAGLQAKVSLAVVPFSQAELVDTQKWLTESVGQAQGGSGAGRPGGASRAVGALIATSMQRRAVRSMSWNLAIERRDEP